MIFCNCKNNIPHYITQITWTQKSQPYFKQILINYIFEFKQWHANKLALGTNP